MKDGFSSEQIQQLYSIITEVVDKHLTPLEKRLKEMIRVTVRDQLYLQLKPINKKLDALNTKESEDTDALAETVVKHDRKLIRHDRAIKVLQEQAVQS